MEQFNLNEFEPTSAALVQLADTYKWMTFAKDWYEKVMLAKKDLQNKRIVISKTLKADRDKAIKYQKDNIAKEKELIGIIKPVEDELDIEIEKREMEEEMNKRKETLPLRRDELKNIWLELEYTEEFLLTMNRVQFMDFIQSEKARLFEIEREKRLAKEAEEKRLQELKEAEERWRIEAEQRAEQRAIDKEKNRQIEEANQQRLKEIEEQNKIRKEQEWLARLEKAKKYKQRLLDNWYTDEVKDDYVIKNEWEYMVLYKIISKFKI